MKELLENNTRRCVHEKTLNICIIFIFHIVGMFFFHFHYGKKEVLRPVGLSIEKNSKYEDWSYTADTVLMKNVILQSVAYDLNKRCFSHIIVDSILHLLDNPKSTVVFRSNSMAEYYNVKGLYFVEIPKPRKIKDFFRPTNYKYFAEVPVLYIDDSCWFINVDNTKIDSVLLLNIRQELLKEFDSTYLEKMINRYNEGIKYRYPTPYTDTRFIMR